MNINPWIYSAVIFFVVLFVGLAIQKALRTRIRKWLLGGSKNENVFLKTISPPITGVIIVYALGIALQAAPPEYRDLALVKLGAKVFMISIVIWLIERIATGFCRSTVVFTNLNVNTRALLATIARVVILVVGILVILDTVGVSITPLLASLGVGSIAVALALQDTLSNFFGGLYLLADKPIRIGDFVKVDGIEGHVVDIGWRSTRIRTGGNGTFIVPNSKLASNQLQNYDLPNPTSVIVIPCSVSYDADLQSVEKIALDVVREVAERISEIDKSHVPLVRFTKFADSGIEFNLSVRVLSYASAGLVRHELIKALHIRFNAEKIEIPYPQRVIHWNQPPETC